MKNVIIYTPYDCLVKTDNEQTFLESNQHLLIENDKKIISIYPTGKNDKYAFNIDLTSKKETTFYSMIEQENKIMIFLLDGLIAENIEIYKFNKNNIKSSIEISSKNITFITEKNKKIIELPQQSKNFKCGEFSHIIYVKFDDNQNEKIIAYNTLTNKAKMFYGKTIELNTNGFVVHNNTSQSYKEIQSEYYVDNEGLKLKSKIFTQSSRLQPDELLSYNFMEAIKNNDYNNALTYLSDTLKSKIDESTLKNYFGDISYFYTIDKNSSFAISNNNNILYEFTITNNKISEISDNH